MVDGQDPELEVREQRVAEREAELDRREALLADHVEAARAILLAADARDVLAAGRDGEATTRDRDADRAAFLDPDDTTSYGRDTPGRRHAALDRGHAKEDRSSSADDRTALTAEIEPLADDADS